MSIDDAMFTFRKYFPLIGCYVHPNGTQMSYKIRGGERTALQWFKTACHIINDNNLPLTAKTFSNVLGRNYAEVKLLITAKSSGI